MPKAGRAPAAHRGDRSGTPKADGLVYELYALTSEEIKVVMGSATDADG
jgi:hypothetical protein